MESVEQRNAEKTERGCDLSTICMGCGADMDPVHGHYQCSECGWRDSCCF